MLKWLKRLTERYKQYREYRRNYHRHTSSKNLLANSRFSYNGKLYEESRPMSEREFWKAREARDKVRQKIGG